MITGRPVWAYEISSCRVRHARGFFYTRFELVRSDGKIIAVNQHESTLQAVKARFEAWARQPWR